MDVFNTSPLQYIGRFLFNAALLIHFFRSVATDSASYMPQAMHRTLFIQGWLSPKSKTFLVVLLFLCSRL